MSNELCVEITRRPSPIEVMREIFKDLGQPDDVHWVLMKHGTFYTFPKSETSASTFDGNVLLSQALQMSQDAVLINYDDGDVVQVLPYQDLWSHPTYLIFSCLRQKIGWVIVSEGAQWAATEQQLAAVGYLARTRYELDAEQGEIIATSWEI